MTRQEAICQVTERSVSDTAQAARQPVPKKMKAPTGARISMIKQTTAAIIQKSDADMALHPLF